jgi:hypoxanthine phosphoribosyltransferase
MKSQPAPTVLVTKRQIEDTVTRLAGEITRDYRHKNPLLLGVLKGSFMFMADLVRHLDFPLQVEFIRLSSYCGTVTSGKVRVVGGLCTDVRGRDVLAVEDIVDTGLTISFLINHLKRRKAASVKLCALADKPSRRQAPIEIDYLGFEVPDRFLVGYGMDCDEKHRNLPDICAIDEEKECRTTSGGEADPHR